MAIKVEVIGKSAAEVLDIVKELRMTLVQHVDFDFEYLSTNWQEDKYIKKAIFTFYEEKYATLFAIKWS